MKLKTPLFPMHCFALCESESFLLSFNFEPADYKHQLSASERLDTVTEVFNFALNAHQ